MTTSFAETAVRCGHTNSLYTISRIFTNLTVSIQEHVFCLFTRFRRWTKWWQILRVGANFGLANRALQRSEVYDRWLGLIRWGWRLGLGLKWTINETSGVNHALCTTKLQNGPEYCQSGKLTGLRWAYSYELFFSWTFTSQKVPLSGQVQIRQLTLTTIKYHTIIPTNCLKIVEIVEPWSLSSSIDYKLYR